MVPMISPAGAITITETLAGNEVENVTFPNGGGTNTDIRFLVQADAHVVNASLDIEGLAVIMNGSFRHADQGDFEVGQGTNVTISGGEISLANHDDTWTSPEGWAGADMTNISIEGEKAILQKLSQAGFLPPERVDEDGLNGPVDMDIAVDPAGKIHVVFMKDASNIDYMTSVDNGTTWVNEETFGTGGGPGFGHFGPQVYAGPNGYIHVFYHQSLAGGSPLVYQRSTNNGTTFTAISWGWHAQYPNVVWDSTGTMHMAGYTFMLAPPFPYKIYYWNSTDDGATISTPVQLNDDPGDTAGKSKVDIATDTNDKVHIVWCDGRNGAIWWDRQVFYSNSTDHVAFSANKPIGPMTGVSTNDVKIDTDSNNKVHVVWSDNRTGDFDIYYTNSTDGGSNFASSWAIHTDRTQDQIRPSVEIGPDDMVHTSWDDDSAGTGGDIAYTSSDDSGSNFDEVVFVHDEQVQSQSESEMVLDKDGMPHLVWADSRDGGWKVYYTRMATSFLGEGEITGYADLGTNPVTLDRIQIVADQPVNTDVWGEVRTSPDNTSWTEWEVVDIDDTTIAGPPARYINWKVYLNSTEPMVSPSVTNLSIDFSYYMTEGRYTSDTVVTEDPVSEATVTWNATSHDELLTLRISNDNGTTWTDVVKGDMIEFAEADHDLRYMLLLTGPGNITPVFTDIDVSYRAYRYPTDLELDVGPDTVTDWTHDGTLKTVETIYFTDALAAFLELRGGTSDEVQVIMKFSSGGTGTVSISNIQMVLDLPPVIHDSVPSGTTPLMDEGSYLVFEVNASDPDGETLTYKWSFNGTEVQGATGSAYNHTTTFDDEGMYQVRVNISDGHFTVNWTWTLTVRNVNRMPDIISSEPVGVDIETEEGAPLAFSVVAIDPDNDVLEYVWIEDGTPVAGPGNTSWKMDYARFPEGGTHNVTVMVSDGEFDIYRTWNVTVLEPSSNPPWIVSWIPEGDVTMTKGDKVDLSVVATHPDELPLEYSWYVDGEVIDNASSSGFKFKGEELGTFVLKVMVSDGDHSVSHEWNVTVKKKSGREVSEMVIPWWLIVVLIIVVVVVITLIMLKRKKEATPTTAPQQQDQGTVAQAGATTEGAPTTTPVETPAPDQQYPPQQ